MKTGIGIGIGTPFLNNVASDGGGYSSDAYVIEIKDTGSVIDYTLGIAPTPSLNMNVTIDWGDGTVDSGITTANPQHDYNGYPDSPYQIVVTGTNFSPRMNFVNLSLIHI